MGRKIETFEHEACSKCARLIYGSCITCTEYKEPCSYYTSDQKKVIKDFEDMINYHVNTNSDKSKNQVIKGLRKEIKYIKEYYNKSIKEAYREDKNRGTKGGNSESDSNNKTSLKQKMKDNRSLETKLSKEEQAKINKATQEWEEENGKLPRLRPDDGFTRNKVDSYTGEIIEDTGKYPKKKSKKTK